MQPLMSDGSSIDCVRQFRQARVLVLGDVMLDTYLEGAAARLCSEGPVPVVRKTAEQRIPGGAANVAANIHALEAEVYLLGLLGDDDAATLLRRALSERGIHEQWLVTDKQMSTQHKIRILADGQYVVRFDEGGAQEHEPEVSDEVEHLLLTRLSELYVRCDVVIVSDYCYGVLSEKVITHLGMLYQAEAKPLFVDSKALHRFRQLPVTAITPNILEARHCLQRTGQGSSPFGDLTDSPEVQILAEQLHCLLQTEYVCVTMAERGVFLLHGQAQGVQIPAHPVAQANDVGAGDSFIAALALTYALTGDMSEAARVGIDAASIAVSRPRTATVSYQELLQRVSLRTYTTQTYRVRDRAAALEGLQQALERERLAGKTIVFTNGVFDILHVGHVQLLQQARALGDVLVVGINSDQGTRKLKGAGRPINAEQHRCALVAALDVVDYVVLFDQETPVELIRALRPAIHVKGGDYAEGALPEAGVVQEVGGKIVIVPLLGTLSTSQMIERIVALATREEDEVKSTYMQEAGKERYDR